MAISLALLMAASVLQVGASGQAEPVRLDSKLQEARRIKSAQPEYPSDALRAGLRGQVQVEGVVGSDGKVTEAKAVEGESPLAEAAVKAVRKWRYAPLVVDGAPVSFILNVTIHFNLLGTLTVGGLVDSLRSPHEAVRESAVVWLGELEQGAKLGPPDIAQARRALESVLRNDDSERVKAAAAKSLERIRPK